jgi:hypothetical protein
MPRQVRPPKIAIAKQPAPPVEFANIWHGPGAPPLRYVFWSLSGIFANAEVVAIDPGEVCGLAALSAGGVATCTELPEGVLVGMIDRLRDAPTWIIEKPLPAFANPVYDLAPYRVLRAMIERAPAQLVIAQDVGVLRPARAWYRLPPRAVPSRHARDALAHLVWFQVRGRTEEESES